MAKTVPTCVCPVCSKSFDPEYNTYVTAIRQNRKPHCSRECARRSRGDVKPKAPKKQCAPRQPNIDRCIAIMNELTDALITLIAAPDNDAKKAAIKAVINSEDFLEYFHKRA